MTTNLDLARAVASHVQVLSVSLSKASVVSDVDPLAPPAELSLSQSHRASYHRDLDNPGQFDVLLDFDFRAMAEKDAATRSVAVELHATFVLKYSLSVSEGLDEAAFEQFAWLNGTYNAWPYWRELVQTVTGRVGLGSIVVPVYRPRVQRMEERPKALAGAKRRTRRRPAK